jgi:hypothetical protein
MENEPLPLRRRGRPKQSAVPTCEHCMRTFGTRQAKSSHKKLYCPALRAARSAAAVVATAQQQEIRELRRMVEQLMQQRLPAPATTNTNNGNNNTNNTTESGDIHNTTINITINQFGKEDVDTAKVRQLFSGEGVDFYAALQKFIVDVHCNPEQPQNMNLYVKAPDAPNAYCWDKDEPAGTLGWRPRPVENVAQQVVKNALDHMTYALDSVPTDKGVLSDEDDERYDHFHQNATIEKQPMVDTINTLAAHHKLVETVHPGLVEAVAA